MRAQPIGRTLIVAQSRDQWSYVRRVKRVVIQDNFQHQIVDEIFLDELERPQAGVQRILQVAQWADVILFSKLILKDGNGLRALATARPIVYDYDDALYAVKSPTAAAERRSRSGLAMRLARRLLWGHPEYSPRHIQLSRMLPMMEVVSAGNETLANYARRYNATTIITPTTYDVPHLPVKWHQAAEPVTIGWYGSPDNHWYLQEIATAIVHLSDRYPSRVRFVLISSDPYRGSDLPMRWEPWKPEHEVEQLLEFDIGLMPLCDDEWARGKSAGKAVYYMALGIPAVVSPVGVNARAVIPGQTGFHAQSSEEWINHLTMLIEDDQLRARMGSNARQHTLAHYSVGIAAQKLSDAIEAALLSRLRRVGTG
jgi:hypothetical protein